MAVDPDLAHGQRGPAQPINGRHLALPGAAMLEEARGLANRPSRSTRRIPGRTWRGAGPPPCGASSTRARCPSPSLGFAVRPIPEPRYRAPAARRSPGGSRRRPRWPTNASRPAGPRTGAAGAPCHDPLPGGRPRGLRSIGHGRRRGPDERRGMEGRGTGPARAARRGRGAWVRLRREAERHWVGPGPATCKAVLSWFCGLFPIACADRVADLADAARTATRLAR